MSDDAPGSPPWLGRLVMRRAMPGVIDAGHVQRKQSQLAAWGQPSPVATKVLARKASSGPAASAGELRLARAPMPGLAPSSPEVAAQEAQEAPARPVVTAVSARRPATDVAAVTRAPVIARRPAVPVIARRAAIPAPAAAPGWPGASPREPAGAVDAAPGPVRAVQAAPMVVRRSPAPIARAVAARPAPAAEATPMVMRKEGFGGVLEELQEKVEDRSVDDWKDRAPAYAGRVVDTLRGRAQGAAKAEGGDADEAESRDEPGGSGVMHLRAAPGAGDDGDDEADAAADRLRRELDRELRIERERRGLDR